MPALPPPLQTATRTQSASIKSGTSEHCAPLGQPSDRSGRLCPASAGGSHRRARRRPGRGSFAAALAPTQDRGHTAIDEGHFLQRLYAAGAAPYFDAVLVQPFGFGTGPGDSRSRVEVLNFRRAAWVRRVMVAAGDGQTPVWAVRFGWNRQVQDPWKTVSAANQLRFTQKAIRHARENWPWLTAMGWPVDRPDAPPSDPMWGFSLFTADGQEHPLLSRSFKCRACDS